MFNKQKQARWNALRAKKRQGILTVAESEELLLLSQELDAFESVYLSPAIKRLRQERSEIDAQNRQLEELLKEQEAYLTGIRISEFGIKENSFCIQEAPQPTCHLAPASGLFFKFV